MAEENLPPANLPNVTIPVGLSTSLGVLGTMVLGVVGLVTAVLNGDHTSETITALVTATLVLATTIYGRMHQAAAVYRDAPSPMQGIQSALEVVAAPIEPQPPDDLPPDSPSLPPDPSSTE